MFRPDACDPESFPEVAQAGERARHELARLARAVMGDDAHLEAEVLIWSGVHGLASLLLDGPLAASSARWRSAPTSLAASSAWLRSPSPASGRQRTRAPESERGGREWTGAVAPARSCDLMPLAGRTGPRTVMVRGPVDGLAGRVQAHSPSSPPKSPSSRRFLTVMR